MISVVRNPERSKKRLVDICEDSLDVWRKLPRIDWEESLRRHKTHLEFHSHLPLLIGGLERCNSVRRCTSKWSSYEFFIAIGALM